MTRKRKQEFIIRAALADETNDGWVWICGPALRSVRSRAVIKFRRPTAGRSVYAVARIIDRNFLKRYNGDPAEIRADIDEISNTIVMAEWYRHALGIRETTKSSGHPVGLSVVECSLPCWNSLRAASHPDPVVRLGTRLGAVGTHHMQRSGNMMTHVALLGWGSLLWDRNDAFDCWHNSWQEDGPILKIEFSRISSSRKGALTLVVDPENGASIRVSWCLSRRLTVDEAVDDLRRREKTSVQNVGRIGGGTAPRCRDRETLQAIESWAAQRALGGVVWSDLRSNFAMERHENYSVDAGIRYFPSLKGLSRAQAIDYIKRAPAFVRTPFRVALQNTTAAAPR